MAIFVSKWASLASGFLLELVSGFQYGFSMYSQAMKETHHFSQEQVAMIGTVMNASNCLFSVLAGSTYDALSGHLRVGARVTCGIALLLVVIGYPLLWAMASGRVIIGETKWAIAQSISCAAFFACLSGPFCDATALSVGVRNFPRHRGQVVGQLKSFVGIAASLLVVLFSALPNALPVDFLLLQAGVGILAAVLGVAFQNVVPFKQEEETADPESVDRKLRVTFFGGGAIAAGIAVLTVLGPRLSQPGHTAAAGAVLAGLCTLIVWTAFSSGPIMVSGGAIRRPLLWSSEEGDSSDDRGVEEALIGRASASGGPQVAPPGSGETTSHPALTTMQHEEEEETAEEEGPKVERELLEAEPEVSLLEAWATSEYWLLYAVVTIGTGTGLAIVNNLGQMVVSLGGGDGSQVVFVALYSVMSCFARSLLGEVSQRALLSHGTPRPAFLTLSCLLMAAACVAWSIGSIPLLYGASLLGGFAQGSFWVLMPSMLSEVYGMRYFGTIYTATSSAPALGALLLSNILTARMYDRVATQHSDEHGVCVGPDCFRAAFLIMAALNACGAVASLVVLARTRLRYRTIHSWLLLQLST